MGTVFIAVVFTYYIVDYHSNRDSGDTVDSTYILKQWSWSQCWEYGWITTQDRARLPNSLGVCVCVSQVEQQWSECYQQLCWVSAPDPQQADYVYSKQSPHFFLLSNQKPPDNNTVTLNTLSAVSLIKETHVKQGKYMMFYFLHTCDWFNDWSVHVTYWLLYTRQDIWRSNNGIS